MATRGQNMATEMARTDRPKTMDGGDAEKAAAEVQLPKRALDSDTEVSATTKKAKTKVQLRFAYFVRASACN